MKKLLYSILGLLLLLFAVWFGALHDVASGPENPTNEVWSSHIGQYTSVAILLMKR